MTNMVWLNHPCECVNTENFLMSLFCTPCQFGINQSALNYSDGERVTTMLPGCVSYTLILIGCQLLGILYSNSLISSGLMLSGEVVQLISTCCGNIGIGLYGGHTRKRLREKYGIIGNSCEDFMMHAFAAPCAVCQEANEIKIRESYNSSFVGVVQGFEK